MKSKQLSKLILAFVLVVLFSRTTPAATAPWQQGANLLQNPGFEQPYSNKVAQGWSKWHEDTGPDSKDGECLNGYKFKPSWDYEANPVFVHSGSGSQHVGNQWDTWKAGVQQTVAVNAGSTYRFTVFGKGFGSAQDVPAPSEGGLDMNMKIGIDPNGEGGWWDADVVWSGKSSPHDRWDQFTVEAAATANKIIVITSVNWAVPGVAQCRKHLDVWFDSAQLVEVGPPPTATSPPPPPTQPPPPPTETPLPPTETPTPENTPTNTPVPTDTPTATPEPPQGGTICVNAFADDDANGAHDSVEGYMAGVTFTVASTEQVVGQAVSPGTAEPVCFEGLEPGSYQIAQILPVRLEMTTAANTMLEVEEGKTYGVEFGSRIAKIASEDTTDASEAVAAVPTSTTAAETEVDQPSPAGEEDSGGSNILALSGLIIMSLAVVLLGVLIFLVLRRQAL